MKTGSVDIAGGETLDLGHGFASLQRYQEADLQAMTDDLIRSYNFNLDSYREEEAVYSYGGC